MTAETTTISLDEIDPALAAAVPGPGEDEQRLAGWGYGDRAAVLRGRPEPAAGRRPPPGRLPHRAARRDTGDLADRRRPGRSRAARVPGVTDPGQRPIPLCPSRRPGRDGLPPQFERRRRRS